MTAPTAVSTAAVHVRGLRKSYGQQVVLDSIDLDVAEGSVFALLGPNGAGKTTAIHILSTLLAADGGEVLVGGFDVSRQPDRVRGLIGLTGQVSAVDGQFTGEENLRLMADLCHLGRDRGRQRVAELLERFDLVDAARKPAMTYSGGMRRRLDLAMTLVGQPRIIFLDEPTTGLDPRSRRVMWDIVRELVAGGVTIFLTTQYLEEADRLASRIALLDAGRVVAQGTPAELKRLVPGGSVRIEFGDPAELDRAAATIGDGVVRDDEGLALQIPSDGSVHGLRMLIDHLDASSIKVDGLSVRSADLDDVFLSLTGRPDGRPDGHEADQKVTTP
jgi:ABC-2 type transport system ATP-binding protein